MAAQEGLLSEQAWMGVFDTDRREEVMYKLTKNAEVAEEVVSELRTRGKALSDTIEYLENKSRIEGVSAIRRLAPKLLGACLARRLRRIEARIHTLTTLILTFGEMKDRVR